ncbi:MAG: alpha/beta fold hydrolase [Halobacteria archaeon]
MDWTFGGRFPFVPHFAEIGAGLQMHYVDEGKGEPILFLHGNPTWSFLYRNILPSVVGAGFRAIAPDYIGFGRSDKRGPRWTDYTIHGHIADLTALADRLDLRDVTVVVHDWGGPIGLGWAAGHLDRVKRLVILNTWAFKPHAKAKIPPFLAMLREPKGEGMVLNQNFFVEVLLPGGIASKQRVKEVMDAYRAPFPTPESRAGVLAFPRLIPMASGEEAWPVIVKVDDSLGKIADRPALILWGGRDLVFPVSVAERFQERLPSAKKVVFPEAGHFLQEDVPEGIAKEMVAFLRSTP